MALIKRRETKLMATSANEIVNDTDIKSDEVSQEDTDKQQSVTDKDAVKTLRMVDVLEGTYVTSRKAAEMLGGIRITKANYLATHGKIEAVNFSGIIAFLESSVKAYVPVLQRENAARDAQRKEKELKVKKSKAMKEAKAEIERKLKAGEL
jgi:hypothetical protein